MREAGPMTDGTTRFIGLDVHKETVTAAVAETSTPPDQILAPPRHLGPGQLPTKHHAYDSWLNTLSFEPLPQQLAFEDYVGSLRAAEDRRRRLHAGLQQCAEQSSLLPLIAAIQCLRGLAFHSAATIVAEAGDFTRFPTARQFMGYTGLTPSEHSSGQTRRRGQITRSGNAHLRHILVQA